MISERASKYTATSEGPATAQADSQAAYETLTRKLGTELRAHIRAVAMYTVLTPEWLAIADTVQHIASIATMEETSGSSKEGSLWDREDICVRYLLEEGKLNLILRMLNEHRDLLYRVRTEPGFVEALIDASEASVPLDADTLQHRIYQLEHSLGEILRVSYQAQESLQTTDLPLLFEHTAKVLRPTLEEPPAAPLEDRPDLGKCQESQVIFYLAEVAKKLEVLPEARIMELLVEHNIVDLVVSFFAKYHQLLSPECQAASGWFLSGVLGAELFRAHQGSLFPNAASKRKLAALKDAYLGNFLKDAQRKRDWRPLSDALIKYRMASDK